MGHGRLGYRRWAHENVFWPKAVRKKYYIIYYYHTFVAHIFCVSMMAFKITVVTDPTVITLHQLETLYVHLYNTQGPKAGASDGMVE